MTKLKRVSVEIKGEEINLTPKQLLNKLSNLDYWDFQDFFECNSTDKFNHFGQKKTIVRLINEMFDQKSFEYNERKLNQMEFDRQEERSTDNLDQSIYPHGWYQKQDNQIIYGKEK